MTGVRLEQLAWIGARGPDARKFLQGQVSQDVLGQPTDRVALAGLHNPQGRAVAILRLVPLAEDALLLGLPAEIAAAVIQRLRRYVLRAKLALEDVSADWLAIGLAGDEAAATLAAVGLLPTRPEPGALARQGERLAWRHSADPERFIVLAPRGNEWPPALQPADDGAATAAQRNWQSADVAAGLPQVRAATAEAFVAQMLNLDVLQGISFEKGCYTGQEVIARAHYRGRVKRRLQRFRTLGAPAAKLAPGDTGMLPDGRGFRVVEVAALADGRVEFLAVAPLSAGAAGDDDTAGATPAAIVATAAAGSDTTATDPQAGHAATGTWNVESLPLPYALPD